MAETKQEMSYKVTETTKKLIEETIDRVLNDRFSQNSQGKGWDTRINEARPRTDFIIARTPTDGIAAADFSSLPGTIGNEECYIYHPDSSGELYRTARQEIIWNMDTASLPGDTFIQATKDKTGKWIAHTGGSGSDPQTLLCEFLMFPMSGEECFDDTQPCLWAWCTVLNPPCTGSPAAGTLIKVYDEMECVFNVPEIDLMGMPADGELDLPEIPAVRLWAHKVSNAESVVTTGTGTGSGTGSTPVTGSGTGTGSGSTCPTCVWAAGHRCCTDDLR